MSKAHLTTYLRTYRKRSGLTQAEVAFLIETACGPTVSRHESARRALTLAQTLAYEALFGVPASSLFAGEYEKAEQLVEERAASLLAKLSREESKKALAAKKRLFLEALLERLRRER